MKYLLCLFLAGCASAPYDAQYCVSGGARCSAWVIGTK